MSRVMEDTSLTGVQSPPGDHCCCRGVCSCPLHRRPVYHPGFRHRPRPSPAATSRSTALLGAEYTDAMAEQARQIDIDALCRDMRPPTDDDVPMTLDWQPLDTKDKLVAYLTEINEARERARVT